MPTTSRNGNHLQAESRVVARLVNGMIEFRAGQTGLTGRPISKRVA